MNSKSALEPDAMSTLKTDWDKVPHPLFYYALRITKESRERGFSREQPSEKEQAVFQQHATKGTNFQRFVES